MFEHDRRLHPAQRERPVTGAVEPGEGVVQFDDVKRAVRLRRVDQISTAVLIAEEGHIPALLPDGEVGADDAQLPGPGIFAVRDRRLRPCEGDPLRILQLLRGVFRPAADGGALNLQKRKRSFRVVGQRDADFGIPVGSVGFTVEEHHELLRLLIQEDFGPFDDALARLQRLDPAVADVEGDAAIFPAGEIPGAIDVDPHPGAVAGAPFDLVFPVRRSSRRDGGGRRRGR